MASCSKEPMGTNTSSCLDAEIEFHCCMHLSRCGTSLNLEVGSSPYRRDTLWLYVSVLYSLTSYVVSSRDVKDFASPSSADKVQKVFTRQMITMFGTPHYEILYRWLRVGPRPRELQSYVQILPDEYHQHILDYTLEQSKEMRDICGATCVHEGLQLRQQSLTLIERHRDTMHSGVVLVLLPIIQQSLANDHALQHVGPKSVPSSPTNSTGTSRKQKAWLMC